LSFFKDFIYLFEIERVNERGREKEQWGGTEGEAGNPTQGSTPRPWDRDLS